jgi:serine/threonine protein kinase
VKLENLFVMSDKAEDVVLGDFGFAIDTANGYFDGLFPGSPNYMAPEIVAQIPYGEKCDIWSAGVTLFALVTGTHPYDLCYGIPDEDVIHEQIRGSIINPQCQDLLCCMLRHDPDYRISAEAALRHSWFTPLTKIGQEETVECWWDRASEPLL